MRNYKTVFYILFAIIIIGTLIGLFFISSSVKKKSETDIMIPEQTEMIYTKKSLPAKPEIITGFDDGLYKPWKVENGVLDQFGEGVISREIYKGVFGMQKIPYTIEKANIATNGRENFAEYKVVIHKKSGENNATFSDHQKQVILDVTPQDLNTINGADCSLKRIKFGFDPSLTITVISRPFIDTWITPSMATMKRYTLKDNKMELIESKEIGVICDVTELF